MRIEGNLKDYDEVAFKKVLVKTFKAFIGFCEEHQLTYMVCAGTCIGAVRHHGIIPWDDDIDVFMIRSEYNKLLSLRSQLPNGYALVQMNENNYYAPIPKFYDVNTTLWEEKSLETIIGVYVDIFVLDKCDSNAEYCNALKREYESAYLHYMDSKRIWTWSDIWDKIVNLHPMGFIRLLKDRFFYSHFSQKYLQKLQSIQKQFAEMSGTLSIPIDGAFAWAYEESFFEKTVDCEFEGMMVKIPYMYDAYLTQTYGNYMQFPPVEKRKSTHSHFYLNLEKGMTLDEVKTELGMK